MNRVILLVLLLTVFALPAALITMTGRTVHTIAIPGIIRIMGMTGPGISAGTSVVTVLECPITGWIEPMTAGGMTGFPDCTLTDGMTGVVKVFGTGAIVLRMRYCFTTAQTN